MSRKIVEIPEMNPIRFIEEAYPYPDNYAFYSNWLTEQLKEWDATQHYQQKFTMGDYIGIQLFHSLAYTDRRIDIYNCRGELIAQNISATSNGTLSGNIVQNEETGNVPYQLYTYNWQFAFNDYVSTEGTYFVRIKLSYEIGETTQYDYYISEPILVQYEHSKTVLLEYVSNSNKLDTHYKNPTMFFHLRVEGEIDFDSMANNLTMYDDQKMNPRLQNAVPYRKFALKLGYFGGVPAWMLDKVDRAFSNDYVVCEKTRYTRDIDAQIDVTQRIPRWKKYGAKLIIREYDNNAAATRIRSLPFTVYTVTQYPYYAYEIKLRNGTTENEVNVFSGFTVDDATWHSIFVNNVLNGVYKQLAGLKGYFAIVGTDVVYYNGAGEFWTDALNTRIFENYTQVTAALPFFAPNIDISAEVTSGIGVSWRLNNGGDSGNYPTGTQTLSKNYGTGINATIRIFFDDVASVLEGYTGLEINNQYVDSVSGQYPFEMELLDITGTNITTFDFDNVYRLNLETINIKDNSLLTSLTNFGKNWEDLLNIDFTGNALSSTEVDSVFNQYAINTSPLVNGNNFDTSGQTPSAPPTAASATARTNIAAAGWTVITD